MLYNATGFEKIYLAYGYTDLRRGIDGLASIVQHNFNLDPFQKNVLFMFCGRKNNRIKCLLWEGDGMWMFCVAQADSLDRHKSIKQLVLRHKNTGIGMETVLYRIVSAP